MALDLEKGAVNRGSTDKGQQKSMKLDKYKKLMTRYFSPPYQLSYLKFPLVWIWL